NLDGATHTISRPLEPIASRAAAGQSYKLQIVPATTLYGLQTSLGLANFSEMHIDLPLADAAGTPGPAQPVAAVKHKKKKKSSRKKCKKLKHKRGKKSKKARRRCAKHAAA
ncbi:MAG: hypothetical protein QOD60_296, partial [Solirubrobacterales bacterium]|nr:hypothetical protein [Solirubrobacterales bacterium]